MNFTRHISIALMVLLLAACSNLDQEIASLEARIAQLEARPTPDLSEYTTLDDIPPAPAPQDLSAYALRSELPNVDAYATLDDIPPVPTPQNLSAYALRSELPNLNNYARLDDIPPVPTPPNLSIYALRSELPAIRESQGPSNQPTQTPNPTRTPTSVKTPVSTPTAPTVLTPTPMPAVTSVGMSRDNPAPSGATVLTHDGLALTLIKSEYTNIRLIYVRVQNLDGPHNQEYSLDRVNFRLLLSSGNAVSQYTEILSPYCTSRFPNKKNVSLTRGGFVEGILCFDIAEEQDNLILFYEPHNISGYFQLDPVPANRRWMAIGESAHIEPVREVEILAGFAEPGFGPAAPASLGTPVRTKDGLEIAVIDHNRDAGQLITDTIGYNLNSPLENHNVALIRVQIQNVEGPDEVKLDGSGFRLTGSSGAVYYPEHRSYHPCTDYPDEIAFSLFRGGTGEGNICFEIPESESNLVLIYDPVEMPFRTFEPQWTDNRRWLLVSTK